MSFGFKSIVFAYSRLVVFACALLLGIQVPSFIEQYKQRVDAHFREVSANISGFQSTANLLFNGDLDQLVAYYANSNDAVFERDAQSVGNIVSRFRRLSMEQAAMQEDLVSVALHVMFAPDQELFDEALAQYSYTVPLNALAVQWGLALAIILTLSVDGVLFGCGKCIGYVRSRRRHAGHHKNPEPH